MTNDDIIAKFQPKLIDLKYVNLLKKPLESTRLLIYGEIHGAKENADIVYTLVRRLGIRQLAVETNPNVNKFIRAASNGIYDFSLIDSDTFDTSILSLEIAKTIATLIGEGQIQRIHYIDTYFNDPHPLNLDHTDSPQDRERALAKNIIALDRSEYTLCILGQWHTQPHSIELSDGTIHKSALYRIRQTIPRAPFVHIIYRGGNIYNDSQILTLPDRRDVTNTYCIKQLSIYDFDLHVPRAHHCVNEKQLQ